MFSPLGFLLARPRVFALTSSAVLKSSQSDGHNDSDFSSESPWV